MSREEGGEYIISYDANGGLLLYDVVKIVLLAINYRTMYIILQAVARVPR